MADQGALVGNPDATSNLPKQHLVRRVYIYCSFIGHFSDKEDSFLMPVKIIARFLVNCVIIEDNLSRYYLSDIQKY